MKLEFAVSLFIYATYLVGLLLLFSGILNSIYMKFKLRHRLGKAKVATESRSALLNYINNILLINFRTERSRQIFLSLEAIGFVVVFALGLRNFNYPLSVLLSLIACSFPFLIMMVRLQNSQRKVQKEGISLVSSLYREYRMNNLNISEAIQESCRKDGAFPESSKQLKNLLLKLRSSCGLDEVREAINSFSFFMGSSWGKMLGICIRIAYERGKDVSSALEDILTQLKALRENEAERNQLNAEAMRMTLFLVPFLYIGSLLMAIYYLKIPMWKLLQNQFMTPEGFFLLLVSVFMFLVNIVLLRIVSFTKVD